MIPRPGYLRALRLGLLLAACVGSLLEVGRLRRVGVSGVASAQENQPKQLGGDVIPLRQVADPYAVFNGIAIDPINNVVAMSDVNRKSLLNYDRTVDSSRRGITAP